MESLYEKLKAYEQSDYYGFHMPGHKRQCTSGYQFYGLDITEIEGFDDLHHPQGILKDAMEEMQEFYQSDGTWILVNGSTCGILSSISAVTEIGDEILIARNCHKSVYHGVYLRNLQVHYIYPKVNPEFGINEALDKEQVEAALMTYPRVKALVMVSPTYEGVVSDIVGIAEVCHRYGIYLIVDQAHGAHFAFSEKFSKSALNCGADIVIESYHKTLPSLTQTAVMHMGTKADGEYHNTVTERIDLKNRIERYLKIYQSSSPSYLLMGSIIECFRYMISDDGQKQMSVYAKNLNELRGQIRGLNKIHLLEMPGEYDQSKLVFYGEGMSGHELADLLLKHYHLQMEMSSPFYVVAMTSLWDTQEGFTRLMNSLREIDIQLLQLDNEKSYRGECRKIEQEYAYCDIDDIFSRYRRYARQEILPLPVCLTSYEASLRAGKRIKLEECVGEISKEMLYVYPPGIPFVVPGEGITEAVILEIEMYEKLGYAVQGNQVPGTLEVVVK
ncbi:MAG: aminotransferase class I/II-fold pyridoxal phosphate-dependent enzyme [Lachnospiraceae bacterium]